MTWTNQMNVLCFMNAKVKITCSCKFRKIPPENFFSDTMWNLPYKRNLLTKKLVNNSLNQSRPRQLSYIFPMTSHFLLANQSWRKKSLKRKRKFNVLPFEKIWNKFGHLRCHNIVYRIIFNKTSATTILWRKHWNVLLTYKMQPLCSRSIFFLLYYMRS